MAEKASADRVAADMQPANFRAAVQLIRHSIQKKKEKIQGINQAIGEDWGKVEGHKVNKKAGRIFGMLDKLEQDERIEIMRSLNGLIDGAGWDETAQDLVDAAESNVVPLRVGGANAGGAEGEGDDAGDGGEAEMAEVEAAIAEPAAKPRRGRKAKTETDPGEKAAERQATTVVAQAARDRIEALRKGANSPMPEYTGDNSDLAGE